MASKAFKMPTAMLLVEWKDASSVTANGTWKSWKKLHKEATPAVIRSLGYVVKDEPEYVVLTSQLCVEDGANDGNITILKVNIIKQWTLVEAKDGAA